MMNECERAKIERRSERFLTRIAGFLNDCPDCIDAARVQETARELKTDLHEAYLLLLAGAMDLYADRPVRERYLSESVIRCDPAIYRSDPYRQTIRILPAREGEWELCTAAYAPYELFVCGDMEALPDGRILPRLGYFAEPFSYPCVLQGGREWMSVKPNEIETMQKPLSRAHGHVCAYGLGMGYFAFMASEREQVRSVTVVERDPAVIRLFEAQLLPQFPHGDKIRVIRADALAYAQTENGHDFVFADLWHDVSDGLPLWARLKRLERAGCEYAYWIEDTMRLYR